MSQNQEKDQRFTLQSPATPNLSATPLYNLLLAEDNLPDTLLVKEAVRTEGLPLRIYTASDGQEAIEFIAKAEADPAAPCPHVLLLDLNLPKRDGFEVLERVRDSEKCRNVPVLIVTSSDSPADLNQAQKLGARYFRKPPSYEGFLKIGGVLRGILKDHGMI